MDFQLVLIELCRIDPAIQDSVIESKSCHTVIMKGRECKGYVHVNEDSITIEENLNYWVALSLDYNKRAKSSKR